MLRPILRLGDSILSEPARAVETITPEIETLIDDMIETMYAAPGIGLAAPQVGVSLKIFVIDLSLGKDPAGLHAMINPQFIERDGMQLEEEGCLSIPGFTATVARPKRVVVEGLNRHGEKYRLEGTGLLARACSTRSITSTRACSSIGCSGISRDLILRKVKKLSKAGKW